MDECLGRCGRKCHDWHDCGSQAAIRARFVCLVFAQGLRSLFDEQGEA